MRIVVWEDRNGFRRASWVRDEDPDEMASEGMPAGPPDFTRIDFDGIMRELNNDLVERRILDWKDVQREQNAITKHLTRILRREIISLYREADKKLSTNGGIE